MWWICCKRSQRHTYRGYNPPSLFDISIDELLSYMNQPLSIHYIQTKLYALPLKSMFIYEQCLATSATNPHLLRCKSIAILLDIGNHRLFRPIGITKNKQEWCWFLKVNVAKNSRGTIYFNNILHYKMLHHTFFNSISKCWFHSYPTPSFTKLIAAMIFNRKKVLHTLNPNQLIVSVLHLFTIFCWTYHHWWS